MALTEPLTINAANQGNSYLDYCLYAFILHVNNSIDRIINNRKEIVMFVEC